MEATNEEFDDNSTRKAKRKTNKKEVKFEFELNDEDIEGLKMSSISKKDKSKIEQSRVFTSAEEIKDIYNNPQTKRLVI
jgi:hypothetical protein